MSIISNRLMSGANNPNSDSRLLINALRNGSDQNIAFGNSQKTTENAPVSNVAGNTGIGLGTIGKGLSVMGGVAPGAGLIGSALSTVGALRNTDMNKVGPREVFGGIGKGLTALGTASPVLGALGGMVNLGTGIYDSFQGGLLGDVFGSRQHETSLDALENAGFKRADARAIVRDWADRTGGKGDGIGAGSDRASAGGIGGISGADMGKGSEEW